MTIPDGAQTVTSEGKDLKSAVAAAAGELGIEPGHVGYKVDMSHFRNATGGSVARTTVRVVAWELPESERKAKPAPKPEPTKTEENGVSEVKVEDSEGAEDTPSEASDASDASDERAKPPQLRGAEEGSTEASEFAQKWFAALLEQMEIEGKVVGTGNDERVHLSIDAEKAGRIVGKRGATLGAIRHLLGLSLQRKFGKLTVDVDVNDHRSREGGERKRRNGRSNERRGRGRSDRSAYSEDKLRALARRAAEKAAESGKTITINLELNSFDRRLVHLEVADIDGVESKSDERTGDDGRTVKYIQISPAKG